METADLSEAYVQLGEAKKEVLVLFYPTQHPHSADKTTKDEYTPIVLSDNPLVGRGDTGNSKS